MAGSKETRDEKDSNVNNNNCDSRSSVTEGNTATDVASRTNVSHHVCIAFSLHFLLLLTLRRTSKAARNLEQFGRTDDIIFLESHVLEEPPVCLQDAYDAPGFKGKFLRFYASYNFDQFVKRPILHQWLQDGKMCVP